MKNLRIQKVYFLEFLNKKYPKTIEFIEKEYVNRCDKKLSPGAMSNCPDRLDGFHDYCLGNRSLIDKGRSKEIYKLMEEIEGLMKMG